MLLQCACQFDLVRYNSRQNTNQSNLVESGYLTNVWVQGCHQGFEILTFFRTTSFP